MAQRDLNKVILIGNIGRDPDIRQTDNGSVISTFSLATNTTWVGRDGVRNERTEWHNIVAWNRLAEICHRIIRKGDQIYIEGRLRTRNWTDESEQRHHRTEVITEQMIKLSHHGERGHDGEEGTENRATDNGDKQYSGSSG
ncbi:MAG: single-stranded DNA-binding protein [Candidatus Glassbacteria bacterium]|nr:single-stranded DNA-binding protein [Candidatus Glassbacteria bacterium]